MNSKGSRKLYVNIDNEIQELKNLLNEAEQFLKPDEEVTNEKWAQLSRLNKNRLKK
jgi:hypothetical protein